jgi:hypothetical protein
MFTTGVVITNGTAWAGSGVDFSMGTTNDASGNFYIGAGDIFSSSNRAITIASNKIVSFSTDMQGGGDLYFNKATRTTIYPTTTNQNLHMKSNGSGVLQFNNDNTGNLTMCVGGGNVGIGVSPTYKLDVSGTNGSYIRLSETNGAGGYGAGFRAVSNGTDMGFVVADASLALYDFGGGGRRLTINSSGNIGIGMLPTTRRLSVESSTTPFFLHNTTNVSGSYLNIWQLGGSNTDNTSSYYLLCDTDFVGVKMVIYGNGNLANVNNSYGAYSDIKLKENIVDATPKLDDLLKVKIRNFNLKGSEIKQIGVIAQELEEIFPGLIEESNDIIKDKNGENIENGEKTKSVKYSVFVPMLIKAIQEQQEQINKLKQLIN